MRKAGDQRPFAASTSAAALKSPGLVSLSKRSNCWCPASTRSLEVVGTPGQVTMHDSTPAFVQQRLQRFLVLIATGETQHCGPRSQTGKIHCHIGRSAGLLAVPASSQHRHRGFRRNSLHLAPYIFVEHHVAHHQHLWLPESVAPPLSSVLRHVQSSCVPLGFQRV